MANYFKQIECPLCKAILTFEDVSTVYEDMQEGLREHLNIHTRRNLAEHILKEKFGDRYKPPSPTVTSAPN